MSLTGWITSALNPWRRLSLSLAGNAARDAGRLDEAADLYGQALQLAPDRTHIRVQRANMLKDAGRFDEAEVEYLAAIAQRPADADIQLQLGHLQKVRGRRLEALAHYSHAVESSPSSGDAAKEMALLGDRDALENRFLAAISGGALDAVLAATADLHRLRGNIDRVLALLPDLAAEVAFPVQQFDTFRRIWDIPPPPTEPLPVSLIVELDGLQHRTLNEVLASLSAQTTQLFEIVLCTNDVSHLNSALRLASADGRFKVRDGHSSLAQLIESAGYDTIVIPAPGAILHRHALAWFGWALARTSAAAFICDEEHLVGEAGDTRISSPVFGQAVDYEILLQANPFGQTLGFRRSSCSEALRVSAGRSRPEFSSALLLELGAHGSVGHIPYPLAALRGPKPGDEGRGAGNYADLVQAHLSRRGFDVASQQGQLAARAKSRPRPRSAAGIHVVIPTRDNARDVQAFVESLRGLAARSERVRLTIVDNGSSDPDALRTLAHLSEQNVDVYRVDEPFNWSRLSNAGASRAGGDLLIFANDDMLMLTKDWDERLTEVLERPGVGAVGAKLLYPDDTIQHAGVLFGWRGRAIHDGLYEQRFAPGPAGRWQLRRKVSAVTGAFFAMPRRLFDDIGGFDERQLAIGYSDLDMSLKIRSRGLAVLYDPQLELTHYESKSRGLAHLSEPKSALDEQELNILRERWPGELDKDVTIHPAWLAATLPFRLLSAPSRDAAIAHLLASASPDPWRPEQPHLTELGTR